MFFVNFTECLIEFLIEFLNGIFNAAPSLDISRSQQIKHLKYIDHL